MKKWISLLCVCLLIIGTVAVSVVGASAEDVAKSQTAVDVKNGDKVSYVLMLDKVENPIIGSDFSVYYDSSVFDLESVADFNDNTDSDEWTAVINPDLDGEVRGVWSILKGVDFSSKRNFITLNLKAKKDASDTHFSYRIRFLYDNNVFSSNDHPQIDVYEWTCDVLINGKKVLESANPQWEDEKEPENGKFVPSYDGNSEHADASIPGVVDKAKENTGNGKSQGIVGDKSSGNGSGNNAGGSGGSGGNAGGSNGSAGGSGGSNGGNGSAGGSGGNAGGSNGYSAGGSAEISGAQGGSNGDGSGVITTPPATTAEGYYILATDAEGNVTATSDHAPAIATADNAEGKSGGSPILWIIIAIVVLAGGGAAVYFFMKKKSPAYPTMPSGAALNAAPRTEDAPTSEITEPVADDTKTMPADESAEKTEMINDDASKTEALDDEKTQLADESSEPEDQ